MIGGDADGFDKANAEFAANDGRWNQSATRNGNNCVPIAVHAGDPPGEGAGIAVELVPGNGKGFIWQGHRNAPWNDPEFVLRTF